LVSIATPFWTRARTAALSVVVVAGLTGACSGSGDSANGGAGASNGAGASGPVFSGTGSTGTGPGGFTKCTGFAVGSEQAVQTGPLDIYLVFDRTASMGTDCDFTPGTNPPVASKACYATYAVAEYFMTPTTDTRLAFQFMSLSADDCNGGPYATPLIDMTQLPVAANDPLVQAISNENFAGGIGTHIEGAIRGISSYTINHDRTVGAPAGRTTIGILMTDGDPNGCDENIDNLVQLVQNHAAASGGAVKMFFIGETGATLANLERYAVPGGANPHPDFCGAGPNPCHYWDVGNGDPAAFASAMASIVGQATVYHPLPCTYLVPPPPQGQTLDPNKVNVSFNITGADPTRVYKVDSQSTCDPDVGGWYYDNPAQPTQILLCQKSCAAAEGQSGVSIDVEFGCASEGPPVH
jgi:hypothetical protein